MFHFIFRITHVPNPTNPADFLLGDKGSDVFAPLGEKLQEVMASMYGVLIGVGVSILVIAGIFAGIMYGVAKDSSAVKDNKKWIGRILLGACIVASVLTFVGIAFGIGSGFGNG